MIAITTELRSLIQFISEKIEYILYFVQIIVKLPELPTDDGQFLIPGYQLSQNTPKLHVMM